MVGPTTPLVVLYAVPRLLVYFTEARYAFSFVLANFGIAIAAKMPMITTTIRSSISVKPLRFIWGASLLRVPATWAQDRLLLNDHGWGTLAQCPTSHPAGFHRGEAWMCCNRNSDAAVSPRMRAAFAWFRYALGHCGHAESARISKESANGTRPSTYAIWAAARYTRASAR